jgi:hypothetical protein
VERASEHLDLGGAEQRVVVDRTVGRPALGRGEKVRADPGEVGRGHGVEPGIVAREDREEALREHPRGEPGGGLELGEEGA